MREQRGYFQTGTDAELFGCAIVAVLAISVFGGGLFYWLLPKAWAWLKTFIHAWSA